MQGNKLAECHVRVHDKKGFVMSIDLDNRTSDVIKCLIDLRDSCGGE